MHFVPVAWHWLVLGMILIIAELFVPSFTIFWFGLGGLLVALCLWLLPNLAASWQLFIWAVASSFFTFLWFHYFRRMMPDRTKAGVPLEAIVGESGQVIRAPEETARAPSASPPRCWVRTNGPSSASSRWRWATGSSSRTSPATP